MIAAKPALPPPRNMVLGNTLAAAVSVGCVALLNACSDS